MIININLTSSTHSVNTDWELQSHHICKFNFEMYKHYVGFQKNTQIKYNKFYIEF